MWAVPPSKFVYYLPTPPTPPHKHQTATTHNASHQRKTTNTKAQPPVQRSHQNHPTTLHQQPKQEHNPPLKRIPTKERRGPHAAPHLNETGEVTNARANGSSVYSGGSGAYPIHETRCRTTSRAVEYVGPMSTRREGKTEPWLNFITTQQTHPPPKNPQNKHRGNQRLPEKAEARRSLEWARSRVRQVGEDAQA